MAVLVISVRQKLTGQKQNKTKHIQKTHKTTKEKKKERKKETNNNDIS